jgi:hypothetical protein
LRFRPQFGQDVAELLGARVGLPTYGLDALLPHLGSERNRTVRAAELGVRDVATAAPMTPETIFALHSMTKPITSLADVAISLSVSALVRRAIRASRSLIR